LRRAFPDLQRHTDILLGGTFNDQQWVSGTGYFSGTWTQDWLGMPATGAPATIRWGEFCRIDADRIVASYVLLDLVDLLRQAGVAVLPPSRGDTVRVPGPHSGDGVQFMAQDEHATQRSLQLVEAMIAGLMRYDGHDLASMQMPRFWHPQMHWYGPGGIGTARGLVEYEQVHARPFLHAFPDRRGGDHKARIAEGAYVASTGWPSVRATFTGDYLGAPATSQPIGMRVMDWWRRDGDLLVQNWVLIDLVDLFGQFGIDLFARMRAQLRG
jgi:hypothetical protein